MSAEDPEVHPELLWGLRAEMLEKNGGFHVPGYVIDCDYGRAWGWYFHPDRQAFIGACCSPIQPITRELCKAFERWQRRFERGTDLDIPPGQDGIGWFSWHRFHADGLRLAKRLKRELGPEYVVIYCRPWEDETGLGPRNMLITADGRAVKYVHVPKTVFTEAPSRLQ